MKIERITMRHLRMELQSHFETSFGRIYTRDCLLLEVHSDGLVGYGECAADRDPGYSYETAQTAWHILGEFIIPDVLDRDFVKPADLLQRLDFVRGYPMAKAGLEMAFWDLIGKREGRSVKDLLGGEKQRVDVGVSVGLQDSPQALVNTVENYLKQ